MKYKKLTLLFVLGILPVAIGIGQACTDAGLPVGMSKSNSNLSADTNVLKPVIDCLVKNASSGAVIDHITALSSSSGYALNPPQAPASISIDCSASSSPNGSISLAIKQNGGAFVPVAGLVFQQMYGNSGVVPMAIQLTDSQSVISSKDFNLPIACNPASLANPLAVNGNAISISAGSAPGYLNINLAGVASGGTGNYTYSVDLNGDGRFDHYNQTLYTSLTSLSDMYTNFDGVRTVKVNVYDTGCAILKTASKSVDFTSLLPAPQSGGVANKAAYYYLQADVSPLSSQSDLADNVKPFNAVEGPQKPPMRHVLCNYNKTSESGAADFSIKGLNTYDDGTLPGTENPALTHGMTLKISNIQDAGGTGPFTSAGTVSTATYLSASSPDGGAKQYLFSKNSSCTASVTVERAKAVVPCTAGAGLESDTVTITGTFSCPSLRAPASVGDSGPKDISVNNGYFFCEVSNVSQCVGGQGQGGGGNPPPTW